MGDNLRHLQCRGIEKLNYAVTEIDNEETPVPFFKMTFNFPDISYKEIKMICKFDFQALVGNVGGYIGLFLGYTMTMIPGFLRGVGTRMSDWIEKKKQNTLVDEK